tara:strand:+ start:224 stop:436 length:213 start_codon:yes stop_codon:yes gene_type:complete
MDSHIKSSPKVTRYRVTLDFTVINRGNAPSNWNWRKLLELNDNENERIKELYVENLGEFATNSDNIVEAY